MMNRPFYKYRLWVYLILGFVVGCWKLLFIPPLNSFDISKGAVFDDREAGGNSRAELIESSFGKLIVLRLDSGKKHPYAGLRFDLEANENIDTELNMDDSLILEMSSTLSHHQVHLYAWDEKYSQVGNVESYRIWTANITASKGPRVIPLSEFKTPNWWKRSMNISLDEFDVRPNSVRWIGLTNTAKTPLHVSDTLVFKRVAIKSSSAFGLWEVLISLVLVIIGLIELFFWLQLIITKAKRAKNGFEISDPNQLDKNVKQEYPKNVQVLVEIIQRELKNTEFSLDDLCLESHLNKTKVNQALKESFGETFKSVLNRIRLEKSKVMLKETELLVSEIAYEVGYNQAAYFTRLFKQYYGQSPKEYRSRP
jgi:AraC-like DNA-binding protein